MLSNIIRKTSRPFLHFLQLQKGFISNAKILAEKKKMAYQSQIGEPQDTVNTLQSHERNRRQI